MAEFVQEEGTEVLTGVHGDHDFVYVENEPVTDRGLSNFTFEEGTGLGGIVIAVYVDGDASPNGGFGDVTEGLGDLGYVFDEFDGQSVSLDSALSQTDARFFWYVSADNADELNSTERQAVRDYWTDQAQGIAVFGEDRSGGNRDVNAGHVSFWAGPDGGGFEVGEEAFVEVVPDGSQGDCRGGLPSHPVFDGVSEISRFESEQPIKPDPSPYTQVGIEPEDVFAEYEASDGRRIWLDGSYIRLANDYYGTCDEEQYYDNLIQWLDN